ncbi:MAG: VOC family protein [Chloroflexi bacterium]|nr:VOC family protein [Chloroflexota bacterium]
MNQHPIVHLEISAKNPAVSDQFYASVFGWAIEVDSKFNYHQFRAEGGPGGAFVEGEGIIPYIYTDDVDTSLARVEAAGGKTISPKMEIPGTGWFALFSDPAGNRIGLFTPMGQMG